MCSSCAVDGAASIEIGTLASSRPCFVKTTRRPATWHFEQLKVWCSTPGTIRTTFVRINSAPHAVQRIALTPIVLALAERHASATRCLNGIMLATILCGNLLLRRQHAVPPRSPVGFRRMLERRTERVMRALVPIWRSTLIVSLRSRAAANSLRASWVAGSDRSSGNSGIVPQHSQQSEPGPDRTAQRRRDGSRR